MPSTTSEPVAGSSHWLSSDDFSSSFQHHLTSLRPSAGCNMHSRQASKGFLQHQLED
jgi:hypothetical protein